MHVRCCELDSGVGWRRFGRFDACLGTTVCDVFGVDGMTYEGCFGVVVGAVFVGGCGTVGKVVSIATVKAFHVRCSGPRYHELNQ